MAFLLINNRAVITTGITQATKPDSLNLVVNVQASFTMRLMTYNK